MEGGSDILDDKICMWSCGVVLTWNRKVSPKRSRKIVLENLGK